MIDCSIGYTASWRVFRLDADLWRESELVGGVSSVELERTDEGMLESGSLKVTRAVGERFEPGYYRVVMTAEQDSSRDRADIATLYCEATGGSIERKTDSVVIEGFSVLFPAMSRKLLAGSYAPKGCDGAQFAASMLKECVLAPVSVEGSFILGQHVVFDLGATVLEAVWDILKAGGFCLQVDGGGEVHLLPKPVEPAFELSRANARMLVPGISHDYDLSSIPNRYIADDDGLTAVAVNDDPSSPVSTVSRGFFVDEVDSSPTLLAGESLADYARRMLAELSIAKDAREYTREFLPGVYPFSIVNGAIPEAGLDGEMRVRRQTISCEHGVTVTEEAAREVTLWQA